MSTYRFGKHTVEVATSSTGMYSPWHLEDFRKKGKFVIATSDVGFFMRVDGKSIYNIKNAVNDVENKLGKIESNYDFYPAEMEDEFRQILNNPEITKEPDILE